MLGAGDDSHHLADLVVSQVAARGRNTWRRYGLEVIR
jgi:hypothetical protein